MLAVLAPFVAALAIFTPTALADSSLSVTFPATASFGQQVTITASGVTDASDCADSNADLSCTIDVYLVPPGGYCSNDENTVSNETGADETLNGYQPETFGSFSTSALPPPLKAAGTWSVCGFLNVGYTGQLTYTIGTIQVAAPVPADCVVPKYGGLTLRQVVRRLTASSCAGGRISYVHSKVPKGRVVRLSAKSGTHLKHDAEINIVISQG
jgi:hypothetical protein